MTSVAASKPKSFLGLSSFEILAMFRRGLFYAYLSIYLRHFLGLSVTETTLFATLPMTMNILCQTFVWGRLSDRFQLRRTLIMTGELLAAAGTCLVWYAHRQPVAPHHAGYVIIIGLSVVEIFWSMSNIGWSALISDIYGESDRSRIQGRLASLGGMGRMAGVWIGGLLYDGLGWRNPGWGFYEGALFFVAAGAMLISILPLLWVPEGGIGTSADAVASQNATDRSNPTGLLAAFLIGMVFINFGRNGIAIIVPQYLVLDTGFAVSSRSLSYIVNTQSLAMIVFGWTAGRISRKWGDSRALLAATTLSIAALLVLSMSDTLPMIYGASFMRGAADVVIMAAAYTMASTLIPPEKRARLFAVFNATFFLSWGLAGTLIAGPLVDVLVATGHTQAWAYRMSFVSAAMITLAGLAIQAVVVRRMSPGANVVAVAGTDHDTLRQNGR